MASEIEKQNLKIDNVEKLLKKSFKDWTEEEKNFYGNDEQEARKELREERKELREERKELIKQKTILLQKEQNQSRTTGVAMDIDVPPLYFVGKATKKILSYNGPLDENCHLIPIDMLKWGKELIEAVDGREVVLLHGPWQSGKTSALRFLQSQAELAGRKVWYIDMLDLKPLLETSRLLGHSIFKFLAMRFSTSQADAIPNFESASELCDWIQSRYILNSMLPLLLIDEYDAFLQVCRSDSRLLEQMNNLITYSRNTQRTFLSIVCAGTFSIVATQSGDVANSMELDEISTLKKGDSDGSFDAIVRPFDVVSPWNKSVFIETAPFEHDTFKNFFQNVFELYAVWVEESVIDDIWETTAGHPGFSMWLLVKALQLSLDKKCKLFTIEWMSMKRNVYSDQIHKSPTMKKILLRVESSKSIANLLHRLVRYNETMCSDSRFVAFLRAAGIVRLMNRKNWITLSSPIIRDALLQKFYPAYDDILQTIEIPEELPTNYALSIIIRAIPYMKAPQLLDDLVKYAKGLSEAAVHAELYRILHSLFRNQQTFLILTETKVVASSDMRCDIWMTAGTFTEFGIEFKTELNNKQIQEAASVQLLKYASSRSPREMVLVNFVRKEAASIMFPIDIKPTGWENFSGTVFSVLFVLVLGDLESGLQFRIASNGDSGWKDLSL